MLWCFFYIIDTGDVLSLLYFIVNFTIQHGFKFFFGDFLLLIIKVDVFVKMFPLRAPDSS